MKDQDELNRPSRQQLAIDRTHLANERTLLAYIRTSLAMIGFGVLIFRFETSESAGKYGIVVIVVGILLFIFGIIRFYQFQKKISSEKSLIEQEK